MAIYPGVPEDVLEAARFIKDLEGKPLLTRAEKDRLNQAKLKVAYWALGSEQIAASRENLTYVLGGDAKEIMANYDKSLEQEKENQEKKPFQKGETRSDTKKKGSGFWEDA